MVANESREVRTAVGYGDVKKSSGACVQPHRQYSLVQRISLTCYRLVHLAAHTLEGFPTAECFRLYQAKGARALKLSVNSQCGGKERRVNAHDALQDAKFTRIWRVGSR